MKIKLVGIETAKLNLRTLDSKLRRKVVRSSTREAAKIAVKAAQRTAPMRTGAMRRSIKITGTRFDGKLGAVSAYVGSKGTKSLASKFGGHFYEKKITRGKRKGKYRVGSAFYHHMVVRGTKPHTIRGPSSLHGKWYSNIKHPGARPNNFYARAAAMSFNETVREFSQDFGKKAAAEAARLPK